MAHLDQDLLAKISDKIGRDRQNVRVRVSQLADRLGISAEAALVVLAKRYGVGTAYFQRSLSPTMQAEVRDALLRDVGVRATERVRYIGTVPSTLRKTPSNRGMRKAAIESLIQDDILKSRCTDLLLGNPPFDRAVNQATLVLEDRIRKRANQQRILVGENLVNRVINSDLNKTILVVSREPDEQKGLADIFRGIMLAYRNPSHHTISQSPTSREDAMRVCFHIDVLLGVVGRAREQRKNI